LNYPPGCLEIILQ